jgi:lipoprotein-anchoring transpeptidase ErfK/SrfK
VAAALLLPAAAAAQDPVPPPPPPAPTPAPPPPPKPAIALEAAKVHVAGKSEIALRGKAWRLRGVMTPAVAGEKVTLTVHRDGKKLRTVRARVGADGRFKRTMKPKRAGRYSVRASHKASAALAAARGPKLSVQVVEPRLAQGARGPLVRLLQRNLDELAYAVPRNDTFDAATGRAVMAFRKVNGMARRYDADRAVIEKVLAGRGAFKPKHPDAGRHVEGDIGRQVLALVNARGKVVDTYHTSPGAPATPTIIGSFRVYRKDPGTNALGMYKSSYFIRGYAIHGYVDVPAFNASHGCLRVPMDDATRIYNWVRMGDRVITYP